MKFYKSGEYRATKEWPYSISAGCVVYREVDSGIKVLLLTRDSSKSQWGRNGGQKISYHLPKGHCDINETLQQSAMRETEEEAGVNTVITTYLGSRPDMFFHPNTNIKTDKAVHYFAALWQKDLDIKDNEHDDVVWVSLKKAEELLGKPNPKGEDEVIRRLKNFLEISK